MKLFLVMIFLIFFAAGCSEHITEAVIHDNNVSLKTDKASYDKNSAIHIKLTNDSDSSFAISLICGDMLQMFYQVYENNHWSESTGFFYVLGCPTFFDSVQSGQSFQQSIPAAIFKSTGTFRLFLNEDVISNSFDIN